jgi:hypothetical protein
MLVNGVLKQLAVALLAISALQPLRPAFAAEIGAIDTGDIFYLSGEILPGDNEKLQKLLADVPPESSTVLHVNSVGGSVLESFRLAETMRQHKMDVTMTWSSVCYSACFTLIAAARRFATTTISRIGVHGARSASGDPLDSVTIAMIREYQAMGVPPSILGKMAATPSNEIALLDVDELSKMRKVADVMIDEATPTYIARSIIPEVVPDYKGPEATVNDPYPFNCWLVYGVGPASPPAPYEHWHYCTDNEIAAQDAYRKSPAGQREAEAEADEQKRNEEIRGRQIDAMLLQMPLPGSPAFWRWVEQHQYRASPFEKSSR